MSLNTWAITRVAAACVGAALLSATPLHAGEKTDILYMRNGDRLTCEIKTLEGGSLQVSLDYVDGTISIDWLEIERLDSKRLFIVKLEDGSVYTGTLSIAEAKPGAPAKLQISSGPGSFVLIDKEAIVQMGETSNDFWQRFAVDIAAGIIFAKANSQTQYNLSASVTYPRPRWSAALLANSSLSTTEGTAASTRNQLDLSAYHLLPPRNWFYGVQGALLQSTEQGVDLRSSIGGGVGRYFKNSETVSLSFTGGLAYQNTQYSPTAQPEGPADVLTALLAGNLSVVSFKKTNLTITVNALPALSQPGRLFLNTNGAFFLKLFSNLTFNVSFYGSWDTEPPANYSGSDYGFSSGLGWTFGSQWTTR
jgi:Protein of unknown function, DUF481